MTACMHLGAHHYEQGAMTQAIEPFERAKTIAQELGERRVQMKMCINLGACYFTTTRTKKAAVAYEQARAIAEKIGDREELLKVHVSLGACYWTRRQFDRAIMQYEQAIRIGDEMGELDWKGKAFTGMVKCKLALRSMQMRTSIDNVDSCLSLQQHHEAIGHNSLDDPEEREGVRSDISDQMAKYNSCGKKEEGCHGVLDLSEPAVFDPLAKLRQQHTSAMPSPDVAPFDKKEGTKATAAVACGTLWAATSTEGEEKKNADYAFSSSSPLLLQEEEEDNKNVNKKRYKNKRRKHKVSGKTEHTVTAAGAVKLDEDKQEERNQLCGKSLVQEKVRAGGPNEAEEGGPNETEAPVSTNPHMSELGDSLQVLLEKYDLENEPLLGSNGIKKLSDLQYLTCDVIKHLTLSPVSKAKLKRLVADVASVHGPVDVQVVATSSAQPADGNSVEGGECVVCLEMEAQIAVIPCGHICLCAACSQHQLFCPICRVPVTGSLRIYFSALA